VSWLDDVDDYIPRGVSDWTNNLLGPSAEPVTPGGGHMPGPASSMPLGPDGRPVPVTAETLPDFIRSRWAASMNGGVSPEVAASLGPGETAGTMRGGSQTAGVMTDFYGVPVTLPEGMTPEELLAMMRDNPNAIGRGPGGAPGEALPFEDITAFPPAGPGGRQVGDHADLDIIGGDDGLVIYNDVDVSDGEFGVNTGMNEESGVHPVSGRRNWGFVPYGDGQYMFYTAGSDSHNTPGTDMMGRGAQHQTWMAMSRALQREVAARGGSTGDVVFDRERQDADLMNRAPGTISLDDIRQDGAMESDERGRQMLADARDSVLSTDTSIDDYLLDIGEVAGDGLGTATRYGAMGVDYLAENFGETVGTGAADAGNWLADTTGWDGLRDAGNWINDIIPRDIGNPDDYEFGAGDIVEFGADAIETVSNVASSAYDTVSDGVGSAYDSVTDW
jgi:hypothetical protein